MKKSGAYTGKASKSVHEIVAELYDAGIIDMYTMSESEIEDKVFDAIAFERDTLDAKFLTHEEIWNLTTLSGQARDTLPAVLDDDAEPGEGQMDAAALNKQ